jgi:integrase
MIYTKTTAIVFDHRGRAKKNERGPIEVRITMGRKSIYIQTGIKVFRREFVAGRIINCASADRLNDRLTIIYNKVNDVINEDITAGRVTDAADLRKRVWEVAEENDGSPTFLNWCEDQIEKINITSGTRRHYYTLLSRLTEFGRIQQWKDLTTENIVEFDVWLHQLCKPITDNQRRQGVKGEKVCQGTVYNYHKKFRRLLNRAMVMGKIEETPYAKLVGMFPRGDKETVDYLTKEELSRIESLSPTPGTQIAMARDIFLFQAYTGMGYADAQAFDIKNYRNIDGRWQYVGPRVKTGVAYVNQLLQPAIEVLERNMWHVPQMTNQKYNVVLKKIGAEVGIKGLHSHIARHTFATWMLSEGVRIENIGKMLGQRSIRTTQRYAKVRPIDVYAEFDRVAEKL